MQARLQVRKSPSFLAVALFALAASVTLGGGLGYTLRSSVTAPGPVRVVVVHSAGTDGPANRNDCIWTNGHKSC